MLIPLLIGGFLVTAGVLVFVVSRYVRRKTIEDVNPILASLLIFNKVAKEPGDYFVAMDISGSMPPGLPDSVMSAILHALKIAGEKSVHAASFDTAITEQLTIDLTKRVSYPIFSPERGRGGTLMKPVYDEAIRRGAKGVILASDFCAHDFKEVPPVPTLFVRLDNESPVTGMIVNWPL